MQQPTPADVSAALERVYSRPEFGARAEGRLLAFIREQWDALREWFFSMLRMWLPEQALPAAAWIVLGLFAGLAIWAVVMLVESLMTQRRYYREPAAVTGPGAAATPDPSWWEAAARDAAAAQRFRDAALALYMAAVLRLDARGVLRYQAGKTPGEYRREARSAPDVARSFDAFVRRFLPVAFAAGAPAAAEYDELRSAATTLGVNV